MWMADGALWKPSTNVTNEKLTIINRPDNKQTDTKKPVKEHNPTHRTSLVFKQWASLNGAVKRVHWNIDENRSAVCHRLPFGLTSAGSAWIQFVGTTYSSLHRKIESSLIQTFLSFGHCARHSCRYQQMFERSLLPPWSRFVNIYQITSRTKSSSYSEPWQLKISA
jgi:hypothetical protein